MQCVSNCNEPGGRQQVFEQPLWQTLTMFAGESLCLFVFLIMISRFRKPDASSDEPQRARWTQASLFWIPAACDILGTTSMNVGLLYIPVSIYQMLRGALVLWVALFSVIFLHRKLDRHHWISLAVVMLGVSIVGLSSIRSKPVSILVTLSLYPSASRYSCHLTADGRSIWYYSSHRLSQSNQRCRL